MFGETAVNYGNRRPESGRTGTGHVVSGAGVHHARNLRGGPASERTRSDSRVDQTCAGGARTMSRTSEAFDRVREAIWQDSQRLSFEEYYDLLNEIVIEYGANPDAEDPLEHTHAT